MRTRFGVERIRGAAIRIVVERKHVERIGTRRACDTTISCVVAGSTSAIRSKMIDFDAIPRVVRQLPGVRAVAARG